jgi:hypothetical protein
MAGKSYARNATRKRPTKNARSGAMPKNKATPDAILDALRELDPPFSSIDAHEHVTKSLNALVATYDVFYYCANPGKGLGLPYEYVDGRVMFRAKR